MFKYALILLTIGILLLSAGCGDDPLGTSGNVGYLRVENDSEWDAEVGVDGGDYETIKSGEEREWTINLGEEYCKKIWIGIQYPGYTGIYEYNIVVDMVTVIVLD